MAVNTSNGETDTHATHIGFKKLRSARLEEQAAAAADCRAPPPSTRRESRDGMPGVDVITTAADSLAGNHSLALVKDPRRRPPSV